MIAVVKLSAWWSVLLSIVYATWNLQCFVWNAILEDSEAVASYEGWVRIKALGMRGVMTLLESWSAPMLASPLVVEAGIFAQNRAALMP